MIAVVIPYYKIYFLDQLLNSLKSQTDQRFRVYIGNDNSPDDPEPIISKYRATLNITYKKFETNVGGKSLTKQWERCMELIGDEEWFMLPGDDDFYGPQVIAKFYEHKHAIDKHQIKVVKYATVLIDENDQIISKKYTHPAFEKSTDAYFRKFLGDSRSSICEYVFSTAQYRKYRFKHYPLAWSADSMAILQWSNFGLLFSINDAVVNFRYSNHNISGQRDTNRKKKNRATYLFFKDLLFFHSLHFSWKQRYYLLKYTVLYGFLSFKNEQV